MTLHRSKHDQTYINNLNAALPHSQLHPPPNISSHNYICEPPSISMPVATLTTPYSGKTLPHLQHSKAKLSSAPKLSIILSARYGSVESFQEKFTAVLLGLKGSGWGWLLQDSQSKGLEIIMSKDQDIVPAGKIPSLGVDSWEHAYYLQYLNDKAGYAKQIWKIINWKIVEGRYLNGEGKVWGTLKGLRGSI
jgi:Fe-Mn family superoxide dismutase